MDFKDQATGRIPTYTMGRWREVFDAMRAASASLASNGRAANLGGVNAWELM